MITKNAPYITPRSVVLNDDEEGIRVFEAIKNAPDPDWASLEDEAKAIRSRILASKAKGTF